MGDYQRIEKAILFLEKNAMSRPSLSEAARAARMSEFHFQRLFSRWAGVSPKRFLQFLSAKYAKQALLETRSVLEASFSAGLSGPGRLHDLLVTVDGVSPGEFKSGGDGLVLNYGSHPSPFGNCFIALSPRGICALSFLSGKTARAAAEELAREWPEARLKHVPSEAKAAVGKVFGETNAGDLRLHLRGSRFRLQVWQALLRVPEGGLVSYADIARSIGAPRASRAVGGAVGGNPVAFLIPCHRVIRESGVVGDYRWGSARKRAIIAWEAARKP